MVRNKETYDPENDIEFQTLREISASMYDKVWVKNEIIYGLTKPVIMTYCLSSRGTQDPFRANAGRFVVSIKKDGSLDFVREDAKVAWTGYSGCISPHNNVSSICWGNYRELVYRCQQNADYAQLLLLAARHLSSCTPEDCYMQLRIYAEKLNLKMDFKTALKKAVNTKVKFDKKV